MPEMDNAGKWSVVTEIVEREKAPFKKMALIGAALKYHQFVLHASENPVSAVKLEKMEQETFHLLSPEDRQLLQGEHAKLPPHRFFPTNTHTKGRDGQSSGGNLDDLFV